MLAIVTGLLFFVLGLLASQLSAIRMERLRDVTNGSGDGQPGAGRSVTEIDSGRDDFPTAR
jgi:hypothetical protein